MNTIYETRVVVKFDLSKVNIPGNARIMKAVFSFYALKNNGGTTGAVNGPKSLYKVTKAWEPKTVTWDNPWTTKGGDFEKPAVAVCTNGSINVWESFDVTKSVSEFIVNPQKNYGFLVRYESNKPSRGVIYASEKNNDQTKRPKLVITAVVPTVISTQIVPLNKEPVVVVSKAGKISVLGADKENYSIFITDMAGRRVFSFNSKDGIATSSFVPGPGIYITSINTAGKVLVRKVIIAR